MSGDGEGRPGHARQTEQNGFYGLVGESTKLKDATEKLEFFARRSDCPILLTGESGTGKELAARAVVSIMGAQERCVTVNCATIFGDLALSRIFGHKRGAFTGAVADRPGLVASANEGVLFLDEIGEMEPGVQALLLRTVETHRYSPVGSTEGRESRFRVIAATNRDVETSVREGAFRKDLFYRIGGVRVDLPPLRDRLDDLPLLVDHFLRNDPAAPESHRGLNLSHDALELLMTHDWPGNVRELRSTIRFAALRASSEKSTRVGVEHVAPHLNPLSNGGTTMHEREHRTLEQVRREAEKKAIREALAISESGREAAERLEISEATLYRKKEKYGLTDPSDKRSAG